MTYSMCCVKGGKYITHMYVQCYRAICTVRTVHVVSQGDMYSTYSTCGVTG